MKSLISSLRLFLGGIALLLSASGCIHVDYVGQKFPETPMSREVLYIAQDEEVDTAEYLLIGRFTLRFKGTTDGYLVQKKLMEKAREYGGDAVHVVAYQGYLQATYTRNENEFGVHPGRPPTKEEEELFGKTSPMREETMNEQRGVLRALLYKKRTEALKLMDY